MLKKIIPFAVLTTLPFIACADGANMSGFADITFETNGDKRVFAANAEVDVENKLSKQVSVRIDVDLALGVNGGGNASALTGGPSDSAVLEQAFFAYTPIKPITVIGGVFNNPIGWEKEDAPDLYSINHGQIYNILNDQTALKGNNLAGVAIAGAIGPATITVAAVDELGLNDTSKNSFAAIINLAPIEGLDLELGYVTQETKGAAAFSGAFAGGGIIAGNVWDANATYSIMGATLAVEALGAEEVVDLALGGLINYEINSMFNVTARYDTVSYQIDKEDTSAYALVATVNPAKNLAVLAEYRKTDDGTDTDGALTLEFVALF